ncbi:hypothetical protein GOV12_00610 [Candidatus Pacearchaeota archaeon]|nr:hypothetical protein [Candidatus Pacearchaeota archaeon]
MANEPVLSGRFKSKLFRILNKDKARKSIEDNLTMLDETDDQSYKPQYEPKDKIPIKLTYDDPELAENLIILLEKNDHLFTHLKYVRTIYTSFNASQILELSYKRGIKTIRDDSPINIRPNIIEDDPTYDPSSLQ